MGRAQGGNFKIRTRVEHREEISGKTNLLSSFFHWTIVSKIVSWIKIEKPFVQQKKKVYKNVQFFFVMRKSLSINTRLDIAFKGTVVNQTLPSLHGGSLEIILSPFNSVVHQYLT